jgi:hypothetical protein
LALLSLVAAILGIVLLPYPGCFIAWLMGLAYLLPLWHVFLDTLKRDQTVRSRRVILFQPKSPLNSKVEKKTDSSGRLVEVAPEVYWFMDRNDMEHLAGATADDKKVLTACRIAAGFYKATVSNEVLQLFDSLSLYKFLVDHSNPKTMLAVEDLARFFEGAKVGKVVSSPARSAAAHESPRATIRPAPRQSAAAEQDPDDEPAPGQRTHSEPSADDLRCPEPEEGLAAVEQRVDPRRRVEQASAEEASGLVDDRENGQFDFIEAGEEGEEPDDVVVSVPSPGQTSEAQEEELRSVRDQTIVLPSGTATGPHGRGKRGSGKGEGGKKRGLNFKTANPDGAAN